MISWDGHISLEEGKQSLHYLDVTMTWWGVGGKEEGKKEAARVEKSKIQIMKIRLGCYDRVCYRELFTIIFYSEKSQVKTFISCFP